MFAPTNLVAELGIVLWLLIGWQFAAAEFVGGAATRKDQYVEHSYEKAAQSWWAERTTMRTTIL